MFSGSLRLNDKGSDKLTAKPEEVAVVSALFVRGIALKKVDFFSFVLKFSCFRVLTSSLVLAVTLSKNPIGDLQKELEQNGRHIRKHAKFDKYKQ